MMRLKDIANLQRDFEVLIIENRLTKKNLCDLVIPFRDKYGLTDRQALMIARKEYSLSYIDKYLLNARSNGDNIRLMNDEELAHFINGIAVGPCCDYCQLAYADGACTETLCDDARENWLKQPIEVEVAKFLED